MAKKRRVKSNAESRQAVQDNIRFIVPMPGKSAWQTSSNKLAYKKLHTFKDRAGDLALEDYQAQFLMQREYLID